MQKKLYPCGLLIALALLFAAPAHSEGLLDWNAKVAAGWKATGQAQAALQVRKKILVPKGTAGAEEGGLVSVTPTISYGNGSATLLGLYRINQAGASDIYTSVSIRSDTGLFPQTQYFLDSQ